MLDAHLWLGAGGRTSTDREAPSPFTPCIAMRARYFWLLGLLFADLTLAEEGAAACSRTVRTTRNIISEHRENNLNRAKPQENA